MGKIGNIRNELHPSLRFIQNNKVAYLLVADGNAVPIRFEGWIALGERVAAAFRTHRCTRRADTIGREVPQWRRQECKTGRQQPRQIYPHASYVLPMVG